MKDVATASSAVTLEPVGRTFSLTDRVYGETTDLPLDERSRRRPAAIVPGRKMR